MPKGSHQIKKRLYLSKFRHYARGRKAMGKKGYKKNLPRNKVSMNPLSKPNHYNYTRSYDFPVFIGKADAANLVYMNTDNTYMIIKLHTTMNKMPDFVSDFSNLYNQCQITSVHHTLVPFLKNNIPFQHQLSGANPSAANAVPNYQIFYMPENYTVDQLALQSTAGSVIDSIINQTQRKAYRLLPGKQMSFWNKRPSVVTSDVVSDKSSNTTITTEMERAGYLDIADHKDTLLYGLQLVIRRVDGKPFPTDADFDDSFAMMGWRVQNQVFFRTRRVQ